MDKIEKGEIKEVGIDTLLQERVTRLEDILAAYQRRARQGLEKVVNFLYGVLAGLLLGMVILLL